jgi:hypothetical protein
VVASSVKASHPVPPGPAQFAATTLARASLLQDGRRCRPRTILRSRARMTPEWHRARGEILAQEPKQTAAVIENSGPQEIFHGVDCRDPGNLGTPRSTACCFACEGGSIPALNPQTGPPSQQEKDTRPRPRSAHVHRPGALRFPRHVSRAADPVPLHRIRPDAKQLERPARSLEHGGCRSPRAARLLLKAGS